VDDIVSGILAAWRAPELKHRVFNLSRSIPYTAGDLKIAIQKVIPSSTRRLPGARRPADSVRQHPRRPGRLARRAELGFAPRYDLDGIVASTWTG